MRSAILLCVVAGIASAGPPPKPPKAQKSPDELELDKDEKIFRDLQAKQAHVPAAKLAKKIWDLQRKISGDDAQLTHVRETQYAAELQQSGDDLGAHKLYLDMLADAEKAHGAESREVLYAIAPVLGYFYIQGRYEEVEPYIQREIAIAKKLSGDKSQDYANYLTQYATLLNIRNEYAAALRVEEQALAIHEANAKSKDDYMLLGQVETIAWLYWQAGQKPKAIAMYDRAIAIVSNPSSPYTTPQSRAGILWAIASVYRMGKREDLAKPLSDQVIDIYTKEIARLEAGNPNDPLLPGMYGQLGMGYRALDDLANADKYIRKAYDVDMRANKTYGWSAILADLDRVEGHPEDALTLLDAANAHMAANGPRFAHAFDFSIADTQRQMGHYDKAIAILTGYRDATAKTYGKHHPTYGMIEQQMANIEMLRGNIAAAGAAFGDSLEISEHELSNVLKTGTEADHEQYFQTYGYILDLAINFSATYAPKSPIAAKLGLETLLRRKGRVLDAAASSMATIRSKLSPDDKQLLDSLAAARGQLAKLTVAGPSATGDDDYAKAVAALEDQIAKLEIQVGQKSAAYRAATQPISLAAIQKLVPKPARLVEIVNFQPYDPHAKYGAKAAALPRRYAAYVLAQTGDPVFVDLGPAQPIDDAITAFRKAVSNPNNTHVTDLGHALYTLTIGKLTGALGGSTEILIAPDGSLNLVPFSALVDDKGKLLLESDNFTYLTSGRDLLRLAVHTKAQGGGVMFANPAFDATGGAPTSNGSRGARAVELADLMWPQLPGTGEEADLVEHTWDGLADFRGDKATEGALKQLHGPKILHLATHGFFLPDEPPKPTAQPGQPLPSSGAGIGGPSFAKPEGSENPLLRSGLALAGANKLKSGDDDGILTALEAAGLDLWGTKLVVLSACDTGNGKVTNGDGVYGLRRALVIAGAEGLVMSLWQVDDAATRDLMAGYYARLKAGKARSSALRDIQLEIHANPKYAHPYYWAAFLAAGDNSPLN